MAAVAIATLESISPYSQSRYHNTPHEEKELHADWERRTWRERMHVNHDGYVYIPPMSLKNMLSQSALYLSLKVPGKGSSTYTKHFEAGVLCVDPIVLPLKKEDVPGEWLFVPSDGKRGGTKRVEKCFPVISKWFGRAIFHVLDPLITRDAFEIHLREGGKFIGIGRFRPRMNGFYGRFEVKDLLWE